MRYDLGRLEAEDAITRLIYAYCTGIDTGHLDDTARLFANGTWFLNEDTPLSGFRDVSTFLNGSVILYDGVPGTRHSVSNIIVDLSDDRLSARAQSHVIVFQTVSGKPPPHHASGRLRRHVPTGQRRLALPRTTHPDRWHRRPDSPPQGRTG
jgi:hypothetical protein